MKKINFKTLLLAIGLVVASVQPAWATWYVMGDFVGGWDYKNPQAGTMNSNNEITFYNKAPGTYYFCISDGNSRSGYDCIESTSGCVTTGNNGKDAMWVKCEIQSDITIKVTNTTTWKCSVNGVPSLKFKYQWKGGWAWCGDMTYNSGDKTYSVISDNGYNSAATGFNWSYTKIDENWTTTIDKYGSPATGEKCMFTLVPNGQNAYKLKISKCKSIAKTSYVYFDNSQANWTTNYIQLVVGNDIESKTFTMAKLGDSKMYYAAINQDWSDVTYYALIGTGEEWSSGKWSSSNISNATKKSAIYYGDYNLSNGITTLITLPSGDEQNMTLTYQKDGYGALNKAQTVSIMTSSNGGTSYSASASWLGTLQASRYTLSNNGTGSTTTKTLSSSDTYASGMQTSSITFTEKATNTGYTFTGFNSTNSQPSSTSYTYTVDGAKTIYAFYKMTDYNYTYSTTPQNCTYTPAGTAHYNDNVQLTITPNDGYVVTSVTSPQTTINRSEDVYSFKMPASDVTVTVVTSLSKVNVTADVHFSGHGEISVSPTPVEGKVDAGQDVTFIAEPNEGYHLEGWYSDATCETPIAGASASSLTYTIPTISAAASVYVKFAANIYSVKFNGNGNTGGSMTNQSFTYDEAAKALTANAFVKTGYTFLGWDTDQSADEVVYTNGQTVQNLTDVNNAIVNLYAVWQINTYTLTLPDTTTASGTRVCNFKIDSVKPAPVEGKYNYNTPIEVYLSPKDGYRLAVTAKYNDGSEKPLPLTHEDFSFLYTFNMPAGDATISVDPKEYKLEGNFSNGGGTAVFDNIKHTFDGTSHSFSLNLEGGTSYKFKVYNEAYNGTSTSTYGKDHFMGFNGNKDIKSTTAGYEVACDGADCFVLHAGIGGTYTFSIGTSGNNKPLMNVQYPDESYIEYNNTQYQFSQYGQTDKFITAGIPFAETNHTYSDMTFVWKGTRYEAKDVMNGDTHTNIQYYIWTSSSEGKGVSIWTAEQANARDNYYFIWDPKNEQLTAVYPSYIAGSWTNWSKTPITFDGDISTYTHQFTTEEKTKGIQFKIVYEGKWYSVSGGYIFTENGSKTLVQNSKENENLKINPNELDDEYTFTFDKTKKELTVYYPEANKYKVLVSVDGTNFEEKEIGSTSGIMIHAASKSGYRFTGWETTGDMVLDKTAQTTNVKANSAGTIKATYSNDGFVYFRDPYTNAWGKAHAYFYSGSYWDNNKGSGSKNIQHGPYGMAKLEGSDNNNPIYYFDYKSNFTDWNSHIISFTNNYCQGSDNFNMVQAAYRGDFNSSLPMYVPRNFKTHYLNSSEYYNEGIWMKFNDRESGYDLRGDFNSWTSNVNKFIASEANPNNFDFYTTVYLEAGKTYNFLIYNANGTQYGCPYQTIKTKTDGEHGWKFYEDQGNCQIIANVSGDYTFHISLKSGEVILYVTYPMEAGDYRVNYGTDAAIKYSNVIKGSAASGLISLWLPNGTTTLNLEKITSIAGDGTITWDAAKTIDVTTTAAGVYQMTLTSAGEISGGLTAYTGDYFVRTDCADGGWDNYLTNPDNKMANNEQQPEYSADPTQGYNYYFMKFNRAANGNVRFAVANTINGNLSGIMKGDAIIGNENETLPGQEANIRFAWNSNTNAMSRAYIKGSSNPEDKFVQVYGTNVYSDPACETPLTEQAPGTFKDNQDWVYEYTMYAKTGATATVKTNYNNQEQVLIQSHTIFTSNNQNEKAKLKALYDFKTNRFVAAWTPSGQINDEYSISADIMLMRNGQAKADQLTFGDGGSITGADKTVYGAVQFDKSLMELKDGMGYQKYDRSIFWISFPFDVRLNDVFGLGQYGKYWIIRYYDGAERASKGWFQETKTFWKTVSVEEREHGGTDGKGFILKANEGYNLVLDYTAVLKDLYPNGATENYLFFPSKDKISSISSSLQENEITYNPLTCTITSPEDRTNEDSNWRVIGVPSYADPEKLTAAEGIKFYYTWNSGNNTLGVDKVGSNEGTFQSMYAYMVQFAGTINWSTKTVTPATAPLFAQTEKEEYSLRLELQQEGKKVDQAYVDLTDEATEEFDLNLDITKLMYSTSQIYSFIGNDKVAANSLPVQDVVVPLCVTAAADGTYTIALPDGTDGLNVTLYDVTAGKETNMSFDGYTVNLDKGEYNNRFLLNISVPRVPTNIRNANGEWSVDGKTKKLLINDNIYLINAGRIYNASGTQVK